MTETIDSRGCPVIHTDYTVERPLFETCTLLDSDRERAPFLLNDSRRTPFWMVTEYEHVIEALQMPDVFGNEVLSALTPEHTIDLLPQYLNPPEHTTMRRVLNRWFSPAAVRRLESPSLAGRLAAIAGKPVGLVHFAAASRDGRSLDCRRLFGKIGRRRVREGSVAQALALLQKLADPQGKSTARRKSAGAKRN